jgi:hypothetical protein
MPMIHPSDSIAILVIPGRTASVDQVTHAATELAAKVMIPVMFYRGNGTTTILPTDKCPCMHCAGRNPELK